MKPMHLCKALLLMIIPLAISACGNSTSQNQATTLTSVPAVTFSYPAASTAAVPTYLPANSAISVAFNKAMNPATITDTSFTLADAAGTGVAGTVSYDVDNRIASFKPSADLAVGGTYTVTLYGTIKDLTTNSKISNSKELVKKSWTFTTVAPDPAAPALINSSTVPASGATDVALTASVSVTFDRAMDSSTLTAATFTLNDGTGNIPGTVSYNPKTFTATFIPTNNLIKATTYTATLSAAVAATTGVTLGSAASWNFTTGSGASFAYVCNTGSSQVASFSISSGSLTSLGEISTGLSSSPVSGAIDPSGRFVYSVNKNSNSISAFHTYSGALRTLPKKASTAVSPQAMAITPDGRFAYVADSASNSVSIYSINSDSSPGELVKSAKYATTGTTPTSVTIDRNGRFAYVTNYASSTLSAYTIDAATGELTVISGSPYTTGVNPGSAVVVPQSSGKSFIYVTNYGSGTVSGFEINPLTGALTPTAQRHAMVSAGPYAIAANTNGTFLYVANYSSNNISAFSIDPLTGKLTKLAGSPFASGLSPRSLAFSPSGQYLYAANASSDTISAYEPDGAGALAAIGSAVPAKGRSPFSIVIK